MNFRVCVFCEPSPKKQREWKEALRLFGSEIEPVRKGMRPLQALIERAHRLDDEEFYLIHAERCQTVRELILKLLLKVTEAESSLKIRTSKFRLI